MKAHNLTKGYKKDQTDLLGLSLKMKTFLEGGEASPKTLLDFTRHTDDRYLLEGPCRFMMDRRPLRCV